MWSWEEHSCLPLKIMEPNGWNLYFIIYIDPKFHEKREKAGPEVWKCLQAYYFQVQSFNLPQNSLILVDIWFWVIAYCHWNFHTVHNYRTLAARFVQSKNWEHWAKHTVVLDQTPTLLTNFVTAEYQTKPVYTFRQIRVLKNLRHKSTASTEFESTQLRNWTEKRLRFGSCSEG